MENIDYKVIFLGLAIATMIVSYYPYIKDILKKKTRPHIYTWLVWLITQGTASLAALHAGGTLAGIGLLSGTLMVAIILLLCIRYGTKDITISDTIALMAALSATLVWWQLDSPLLAVVMVSVIDGIGYFPSYRKTYQNPSTETPFFWALIAFSTLCTLLANSEFTILTSLYLSVLFTSNCIMFALSSRAVR